MKIYKSDVAGAAAFFILWLALLWMLLAYDAQAQGASMVHRSTSSVRVAVVNVAVTGALTLGRAALEGEIDSWQDAMETLAYGSVAGAGFYAAKRLAGQGDSWFGLGLAYASASVAENAGMGRPPWSHVRFGVGPLEVRIDTRRPRQSALEINAARLAATTYLLARGDQMHFRGGQLWFETDDMPSGSPTPGYMVGGQSVAGVTLLPRDAAPYAFPHEAVHAIQMLQAGAVTPFYRLSRVAPLPQWLDVQLDWLYGLRSLAAQGIDYAVRPIEIEAYTLTSNPH